jgi:hypothetical protein
LDWANRDINITKEKYDIYRKSDVENIIGWMCDAIKSDYKSPKGKSNGVGGFNDYEQRKYDFDKLEENLLGKNNNDKVTEEDNMRWRKSWLKCRNRRYQMSAMSFRYIENINYISSLINKEEQNIYNMRFNIIN